MISSVSATTIALWLVTLSAIVIVRQKEHDELMINNSWPNTVDYVIIGAGTAGSVVTRRLAEDGHNFQVLLLEAGVTENIISDIPAMAPYLLSSEMDWGYRTVTQQWSCFGYNDGQCPQPRGKVFGGTSTINWMNYLRGNPNDFNSWAEKFGITGWSWNEVMPYYLKSENNTDSHLSRDVKYHSVVGPQPISSVDADYHKIFDSWIHATIDGGYPIVKDLNASPQLGTAFTQKYILNGKRVSAATAFLQPIRSRPNLHIVGNAYVTQILFNDLSDPKRATGVKFFRNGNYHTVKAKREIILSAGTINSPQILMLSGIGPSDHLQKHGINTISHLPVGDNLHDHVGSLGLHFLTNDSVSNKSMLSLENLQQWFSTGKGPLSDLSQTVTMINTRLAKHDANQLLIPDVHLETRVSIIPNDYDSFTRIFPGISKVIWHTTFEQYAGRTCFTVSPKVMKPQSRGWIRLQSPNPFTPPLIDPKYLSNPYDITALLEGIKEAIRLALSPKFTHEVQLFNTPVPGCQRCTPAAQQWNDHDEDDPFYIISRRESQQLSKDHHYHSSSCDEYLACITRVLTLIGNNHVGTCRMGSLNDVNTVVDSRLRVKSIRGLRIIDASIIPSIVSGDMSSTVSMIAERGSQFIIDDANEIPNPTSMASSMTMSFVNNQLPCIKVPQSLIELINGNYNRYNFDYDAKIGDLQKYLTLMTKQRLLPCIEQ